MCIRDSGYEDKQCIRIGVLEVVFDGAEFVVVFAAAVEILDAPNEENLDGRHQRRSARLIENVLQFHLAKIHVIDAEFPHLRRHQVLQDGVAATLAEKRLIADEYIPRRQFARLHVGDEAVRSGKTAHLVGLQDVADQRLGKTIRDAAQSRFFFLEKTGSIPRDLILLAVQIIGILPEYLALPVTSEALIETVTMPDEMRPVAGS